MPVAFTVQGTGEELLRELLSWLATVSGQLITIGLIVLVAVLFLRFLNRAVTGITTRVVSSQRGSDRLVQQRAHTLASMVVSTGRLVILFVAGLTILGTIGISIAPLIASAGIAGLAIAFGAQSLIRDMFTGFFILLEDQYGVGDFVRLGGSSGTVEELSLRRTVLRSAEGAAVIIPNGEVRMVENLSKGWSQAIIELAVAPTADNEQVLAAFHAVLDPIRQDPKLGTKIIDAPTILGMTAVTNNMLTYRALVKTEPLEQWLVERELRRRVREALIERGVPMPPPTIDALAGNE